MAVPPLPAPLPPQVPLSPDSCFHHFSLPLMTFRQPHRARRWRVCARLSLPCVGRGCLGFHVVDAALWGPHEHLAMPESPGSPGDGDGPLATLASSPISSNNQSAQECGPLALPAPPSPAAVPSKPVAAHCFLPNSILASRLLPAALLQTPARVISHGPRELCADHAEGSQPRGSPPSARAPLRQPQAPLYLW